MAKADFEHVLKIDTGNKEAQQQLHLVNKKIKEHTAKEKSIYGELNTMYLFDFLNNYCTFELYTS